MPKCDHNYLKYYKPEEGDTIIDLGASLGEFEDDNYKVLKDDNCFIVCVEPTLWCVERLIPFMKSRFDENKFMILSTGTYKYNSCALFNNTSAHVLNCSDVSTETMSKYDVHSNKVLTPVITLDTVIDIVNFEIDFVKCDIEGSELETFLDCKNIRQIKNLAIASYHKRDNEETWIKLAPFFQQNGFDVTYDKEPYLDFEPQSMLYCKRKD